MHALMEDDIRLLNTPTSQAINMVSTCVCKWISTHVSESKMNGNDNIVNAE